MVTRCDGRHSHASRGGCQEGGLVVARFFALAAGPHASTPLQLQDNRSPMVVNYRRADAIQTPNIDIQYTCLGALVGAIDGLAVSSNPNKTFPNN